MPLVLLDDKLVVTNDEVPSSSSSSSSPDKDKSSFPIPNSTTQLQQQQEPPTLQSPQPQLPSQNHHYLPQFHSPSLSNRMLSLSTSSITSLLPSLYSLGTNHSTPGLSNQNGLRSNNNGTFENPVQISDALARESDVTVSTNVTSQAEYKGFSSYVISCIFLFVWLSWSILPDSALNRLGVYYYPSRWWALAIPSYVLVLMIYMYVALALYNIEVKTVKLDDLRTIVDDNGVVVTELKEFENKQIDDYLFTSTSGIWDLPISEVNKVLYSEE